MSLNEIAKALKGPSVPKRGDVQKKVANAIPESKPAKRIGRPPGKRTDPDYRQVGPWIRKDTYDRARIALIAHGNQEFSELIEQLLQDWLKQTTSSNTRTA